MDEELTDLRSRVATAILVNVEVTQALLEVEEQDGCITLKGSVASEQDRNLVEDIVSRQEGVISVTNNIIFS